MYSTNPYDNPTFGSATRRRELRRNIRRTLGTSNAPLPTTIQLLAAVRALGAMLKASTNNTFGINVYDFTTRKSIPVGTAVEKVMAAASKRYEEHAEPCWEDDSGRRCFAAEPSPENAARRARGRVITKQYARRMFGAPEDRADTHMVLGDLISDLLHVAEGEGLDVDSVLNRALRTWEGDHEDDWPEAYEAWKRDRFGVESDNPARAFDGWARAGAARRGIEITDINREALMTAFLRGWHDKLDRHTDFNRRGYFGDERAAYMAGSFLAAAPPVPNGAAS